MTGSAAIRAAMAASAHDPVQARESLESIASDGEVAATLRAAAAAAIAWTRAIDALHRGDLATGRQAIDEAERSARLAGDDFVLGRVLATGAGVAARSGDAERAIGLLDTAAGLLTGDDLVPVLINRATTLALGLGRYADAIDAYDEIERSGRVLSDEQREVLWFNRGSQLFRLGRHDEARRDLLASHDLALGIGGPERAREATIHLIRVAAEQGDVPEVFRRAEELVPTAGGDTGQDDLDVAISLMSVGLLDEAAVMLDRVVADVEHRTSVPREFAAEALVAASRLDLRRGRRAAALARAERAETSAAVGADPTWTARASAAVALASDAPAERMLAAARALSDADLAAEAVEMAAASVRRDPGYRPGVELLRRLLRRLDASAPSTASSSVTSAAAAGELSRAFARAVLASAEGRRDEAVALISDALRRSQRARSHSAAADLRASQSVPAGDLAALGVALAVADGEAERVLESAELARAATLRATRPARGPAWVPTALDEARAARGEDRRRRETEITARLRAAEREPDQPVGGLDTGSTGREELGTAAEVVAALTDTRALIEYVSVDGRLMAVVAQRGAMSLEDLDVTIGELSDAIGKLLFGLRRMARSSTVQSAAAATMVEALAARWSDRLVPPRVLDADEVVIVPTGALHHLPWAVLPALADRPFVVSPSAHAWLRAVDRAAADPSAPTLVATGPDLPHADPEADEVAAAWSGGVRSRAIASDELRRLLPSVGRAHLCCHGEFRSDQPQFSSLALADGPFSVYDLDTVDRLPPLVVLSACSLGSVDVRIGDDLLGFPAALFLRGVRTLVAAVLPVEDGATRVLMRALHGELAGGASPSAALCRARAAGRAAGGPDAAAAAAFICFGAG